MGAKTTTSASVERFQKARSSERSEANAQSSRCTRVAVGDNSGYQIQSTNVSRPVTAARSLLYHLRTAFLFVFSDFKVVVIPQTAVGCFQALVANLLTNKAPPSLLQVLSRIPIIASWTTLTVLVLDIANQRLPSSVIEDSLNKPWRPMPSGRLSSNEARSLLLIMIPVVSAFGQLLGTLAPTVALLLMAWMYNDLSAGEHWFLRNVINAIAFGIYSSGATMIAITGGVQSNSKDLVFFTTAGFAWTAVTSLVVLTTLQVQDLPDIEGDAARNRSTIPLVFGDVAARRSIAFFVLFWSLFCPNFWTFELALAHVVSFGFGAVIAYRTLTLRSVVSDDLTYKLWCLWLTGLYMLPLCYRLSGGGSW